MPHTGHAWSGYFYPDVLLGCKSAQSLRTSARANIDPSDLNTFGGFIDQFLPAFLPCYFSSFCMFETEMPVHVGLGSGFGPDGAPNFILLIFLTLKTGGIFVVNDDSFNKKRRFI